MWEGRKKGRAERGKRAERNGEKRVKRKESRKMWERRKRGRAERGKRAERKGEKRVKREEGR